MKNVKMFFTMILVMFFGFWGLSSLSYAEDYSPDVSVAKVAPQINDVVVSKVSKVNGMGDKNWAEINKLVSRFGEVADNLTPYYVKQVKIKAILNLIFLFSYIIILIYVGMFAFGRFKYYCNQSDEEKRDREERRGNEQFKNETFCVMGMVTAVILVAIVIVCSADYVTTLLNPEYAAIEKAVWHIGSLK
ncbi:hypothetical protein ACFL08_04975 [Patescibacteria group bacterium]